jgi:hypothetical protein
MVCICPHQGRSILIIDWYSRWTGNRDGGMVYRSCSWSRKPIRYSRCYGELPLIYHQMRQAKLNRQMVFIGPFLFLRINAPPQLQGFFVMIPVTIVVSWSRSRSEGILICSSSSDTHGSIAIFTKLQIKEWEPV